MQTTLHDSPGTLVFCCWKPRQNSTAVTPNGGAKCRWGGLNAGAVAGNWRLSARSVVNLVWSRLSHWASTLFVCSTFAVMQRIARVCQRWQQSVDILIELASSSSVVVHTSDVFHCGIEHFHRVSDSRLNHSFTCDLQGPMTLTLNLWASNNVSPCELRYAVFWKKINVIVHSFSFVVG